MPIALWFSMRNTMLAAMPVKLTAVTSTRSTLTVGLVNNWSQPAVKMAAATTKPKESARTRIHNRLFKKCWQRSISWLDVRLEKEDAMAIKNVMGALVLASLGLIGCDQSKAELDSTKQQLQSVTAERDSLKTQLDATKAQLAAAQQQLDQMKQAAAARGRGRAGEGAAPRGQGRRDQGSAAADAEGTAEARAGEGSPRDVARS